MNTAVTNSSSSKTCHPHRLLFNYPDKINLKKSEKYVAINLKYQLWNGMESLKSQQKTKEIKISAPLWNEEFQLPDSSYSVSDIQD